VVLLLCQEKKRLFHLCESLTGFLVVCQRVLPHDQGLGSIQDLVGEDEVVPLGLISALLLLGLVWVEDSLLRLQTSREKQEVVTSKEAEHLFRVWK